MKQLLRNLKVIALAFTLLATVLLAGVIVQQYRGRAMLLAAGGYNRAGLAKLYKTAGAIYSADGTPLAYSDGTSRHYADDQVLQASCLQWLGDYTHNITNTLEMAYQEQLCGKGRSFWQQLQYDLRGEGQKGDNLHLTINAALNRFVYQQLSGQKAAVVVLNAKTGDVLAMVNSPSTLAENVINWHDIPESALFNRSLQGAYAPGSTFKIVTDLAWLHAADYQANYIVHCKGEEGVIGPGSANELRKDAGHGDVDERKAMAVSCNHFFANVALQAGDQGLLKAAEAYAFNRKYSLDDLLVRPSRYEFPSHDRFLLTWQGIGQPIGNSVLTVTPLHLALMSAAICEDGRMPLPHLLAKIESPDGYVAEQRVPTLLTESMSADDAAHLRSLMEYTATAGLAARAALPGQIVGAKTGTSQSLDANGQVVLNSLLTAYLKGQKESYAVAIVVEGHYFDAPSLAHAIFQFLLQQGA